ncbi:glycosyl transferase family protein [Halorubrum coriense DSM 10284]|uniref:Glycosyl transferase family protein n=1 Tax=Halorubrum coriense DSM 10284 TaxID=1227466 RepID=M0ER39_9EURY|nr:glycosyltransferase family 2 protein [Halorubrum coriense]ELZ48899.1 glycosyl transferase family protein [Halorubrum coriense DSM 10284]
MSNRSAVDGSVSVVLPTRRWTTACDELVEQVARDDEFILACDGPDDPVVEDAAGTPAEVVVAGEPEGCSAKCNALAAALERATGEHIVCTDADFEHGPEWLQRVLRHLADAPPDRVVSTAPVPISDGPLLKPLEGPGAIGAALTTLLNTTAWGGTMAFRREAVDVDEYVADLRRTVSDDALLTDRVEGVESVPDLVREMPVSGTLEETLDRQVRWTRTALYLDPGGLAFGALIQLAVVTGTLLVPLVTVPLVTAVAGLAYAYFGLRRWTFLLAVPAYVLSLPMLVYGLARTEFDWQGRRYRWTGLYDVDVLDRDAE